MKKRKRPRAIIDRKKLLEGLVKEYFKARNPLFPVKQKLFRGESRAIYGVAEDLLGYEIARRAPNGVILYLNQVLTSTNGIDHGRIKPDIAVWKGNEFRLFLDLKMDLGYNRNEFIGQAEARDEQIRKLCQQEVSFWRKSNSSTGHIREQEVARVTKGVRYIYVVVSDGNIDAGLYTEIRREVSRLRHVKMITLVRGVHLNEYETPKGTPKRLKQAQAEALEGASPRGFQVLDTLLKRSF